jgi:predicted PurR-regulated permease PerM
MVLFAVTSLFWPLLVEQANQLRQNLGEYVAAGTDAARQTFTDANSWVRHMPGDWRDFIVARLNQIAEGLAPRLQDLLLSALGILSYLQYLPWLIIVPIVSFFMLKDAKLFERAIIEFAPNEKLQRRFHWLLADVSRTLAAYIRAQITACIEIGAVVTLVLWMGGVPYAVLLGLISGIAEFVPMIGPLFAAVVAIALTMTTSIKMAIIVGLFLGALRLAQDYIIYPRIVGHGIKMHPLIVILAILGGAEVGGLVGIFLSVPLVALVIVVYNHYVAYRGLQNLNQVQAANDA